jgi:cell division transport system permease protein
MLDYFSAHIQALQRSLKTLLNKPLATLITIVVIGMTLTLPALFWVFTQQMVALTTHWQRGGHISLYLTVPSSPTDEANLLQRVKDTPGVAEAKLISSAEGLLELQHQGGMQDIMQYLPENPLPATIEVTPTAAVNTLERLTQLYQRLKTYEHIEQTKLDLQWISRLYALLALVSALTHGFIILLAIAVMFIIGNIQRLAVHQRQDEIQVLKLIGAPDAYISRPFLYSGILYGLGGAVFSIVLVNLFVLSLDEVINQLAATYQLHLPFSGLSIQDGFLLVLLAMLLGWLGARLSIEPAL